MRSGQTIFDICVKTDVLRAISGDQRAGLGQGIRKANGYARAQCLSRTGHKVVYPYADFVCKIPVHQFQPVGGKRHTFRLVFDWVRAFELGGLLPSHSTVFNNTHEAVFSLMYSNGDLARIVFAISYAMAKAVFNKRLQY